MSHCDKTNNLQDMLILNDDCISIMQSMPNNSIDLVVTDPPYLISYKTNSRNDKKHKFCSTILNDDNEQLIMDYINEAYRILRDDKAMYMFCSSKTIDFFKQSIEMAGFKIKNIIVWVKNNWTAGDLQAQFGQQYEFLILANKGRCKFNGKRISDVWFFDRVNGKHQLHQNQKPVDLIQQCILKHSSEGDFIFDGFMGSGTTGVAAHHLNRRFLGVELDKDTFDIAQNRILKEVGSKRLHI